MNIGAKLIFIFCLLFLFLIFQFLRFQKKNRMDLEKRLKAEWGKFSEKKHDAASWERLKYSYKNNPKVDGLDDITWNDLEMNEIFSQMDTTHSSIGEEYLYNLLHMPVTEKEILIERERLVTFFSENESARQTIQILACEIGKSKESLGDYLFHVKKVKKQDTKKHLICGVMLAGSSLLLFIEPFFGVIALLISLSYSIIFYYKEKANVNGFFFCFKQIASVLDAVGQIKKVKAPELKIYLDKMEEAQKNLMKWKKLTVLLPGGLSGSPMDIVLDYVRMFTHIDLILFNYLTETFYKKEKEILLCTEMFGLLESMVAVASYRSSLETSCVPEFLENSTLCLKIENVYHPCLEQPIKNSIDTKCSVLLTGSNASGKSTFLRTTAIASVLAQTIGVVPADFYQAPFYRIYSSMAIKDNLLLHDSYYMAEIKALKRIFDADKGNVPILCFIDEVLRGTNTVERIASSAEILRTLSEKRILCFAATHDMELTQLLSDRYENFYFSEIIENDCIVFDYQLKKGISSSRNAIRLLKQLGYPEEIVNQSLDLADEFLKTGRWIQRKKIDSKNISLKS